MGQRILVVDDEIDVLKTVGFRLQKAGFDVVTAIDGQEALTKLSEGLPDLILLDLRLPGLDGFEVCRRIRSHAVWKSIPVILFTASTHLPSEEILQELGVAVCITKPFEWDDLFQTIKKSLAS